MKFKFSKLIALHVLTFILLLTLAIIGNVFYRKTLIEWWIPIAVGSGMAMLTFSFSRKWQCLSQAKNQIVNYIYHLVCAGTFFYVLFMGANYLFSDSDSTHTENVIVQNKYIEIKNSRSSTRGRAVFKRNTYYLQLLFECGRVKTLYVSQSIYNNTAVGKSKVMTLRKGLFGFPVVRKGI